ncbi:BSD domain-containing protein C22A12.14c [Purpureocillium lavendulum]|uniref:BSD domain-containing protein C22A12.14c n=1 Tax=Purpureocillium lavendulum TaxID=1247861 RepID=A0AB34FTM7_9HYPO|nr:BSD domain-containing protein C22A12.14c [Purpureocillium lavendulum]
METNPAPRTLHLYYRDGHHRVEVTDCDKATVLYVCYRTSSKPHLTICRAPSRDKPETMVGQVSFHHFKSDIDVRMPLNPGASMRKTGWISSAYEVTSPAQGGELWTWERDGAMTSNLKLVDGRGAILATFDNASWSRKKQGTITVNSWMPAPAVLDVMIVTGMAKVEYQRRSQKAHNGAVAAANSGH